MSFKRIIEYGYVIALLGVTGTVLYTQGAIFLTPPCTTPIEYSIGSIDPKFNVTQTGLKKALTSAAAVWNKELGKELIVFTETGGIPVSLIYSKQQGAVSLGKTIDVDQKAYDAVKANVDSMKASYDAARNKHDAALAQYNAAVDRYEAEVKEANAKGGASPSEYQRLQEEKRQLAGELETVNGYVKKVNSLANDIDGAVAELNAAAKKINAKVDSYNAAAGTDFEQGSYTADKEGERINIFEFTNAADLTRTLTHEFGHAISLGHVGNPASVMYAYNIGTGLTLSPEDIAELKTVCKIKN